MELFTLGYISEADKGFWGSVIGAAIGTLGAFLIALFAVYIDRRKNKKENDRKDLRAYNRSLITAEKALIEYIPAMLKASRLLGKISKDAQPGSYMMTLPRIFILPSKDSENFRNPELVDNWLTTVLRSNIVNQLIEDFTNYYKNVRDTVFVILIEGNQPDVKLVTTEQQTLMSFADSTNNAVKGAIEDALRMLAILQLHGEKGKDKSRKFKHPSELDTYKLSKSKINNRVKKLQKEYDPKTIFTDV